MKWIRTMYAWPNIVQNVSACMVKTARFILMLHCCSYLVSYRSVALRENLGSSCQHEFSHRATDLQLLPSTVLRVLMIDGWPLCDSRVWRKVEKQQGLNCHQSKYNNSCKANMSLFVQKMDKLSILSTTVVFCSMEVFSCCA